MKNPDSNTRDDGQAADFLEQLDPALLLLVLVHMTNDFSLLDRFAGSFTKVVPAPLSTEDERSWIPRFALPLYNVAPQAGEEIRTLLIKALGERREPLLDAPPELFFKRMLEFCVGAEIPEDDVRYYLEPMGFVTQRRALEPTQPPPSDFHVLVIGAGMIGLNAAIKLQQAGISYSIVERRHEVGGTWSVHSYPGAAVDIPGLLYAYSFEPNATWSSHYPDRDEYLSYLKHVARKYGVEERVEFGTEVNACRWDDESQKWTVTARQNGTEKTYQANAIVVATNLMGAPHVPDFAGMADFKGSTLHSARWDRATSYAGKDVVLVGTGATACQIVPNIAAVAKSLTVVQRQPTWMLPNTLVGVPLADAERWAREHLPYYIQWARAKMWYASGFAQPNDLIRIDHEWMKANNSVSAANDWAVARSLGYLRKKLSARPDLLEKMTPDFPIFAKYPVADCGYLDALMRPNVDLEIGSIDKFEPDGVILTNGKSVPCDTVVFATGYKNDFLAALDITGRDGIALTDVWQGGQDAFAYLGMMVPGFPNFFYTCGPNALVLGGGHSFVSEEEVHYIIEFLQALFENDLSSMEPSATASEQHNNDLDKYLDTTVLKHAGGANGWFRSTTGRVRALGMWTRMQSWRAHEVPEMAHMVQHADGSRVDQRRESAAAE